jgi:hypothetical protein
VLPALENIGTLFQCFDLLRCTIDSAVQIRKDLPSLFGADQKVQQITLLLFGKSVRIPADRIPMAQRTLLSGADSQGCITPEELLNSMVKAFEAARDGVMAIDNAWRDLGGKLSGATRQIAALRAGPVKLEEDEARDLDSVEHSLSLRRAQVQSDPLGTTLDLDSTILPALGRLTSIVDQRVQLLRQTEDGLTSARARLQKMSGLLSAAKAAYVEAGDKISVDGVLPAPPPDSRLDSLRDWLDRLQEKFDGGMLRPVSIGLQNWNNAAGLCVSDLQKVQAANSAPVVLRNELRGRLSALKAKAQAYRIEEDAGLMALSTEAEALLFTRPTPIARAEELVGRYQALLNERTLTPPPQGQGPGGYRR